MKNVLKTNFHQYYFWISWKKLNFSGFPSFSLIFCSLKSSKMTKNDQKLYLAATPAPEQILGQFWGSSVWRWNIFSPTYFLWKTLIFFWWFSWYIFIAGNRNRWLNDIFGLYLETLVIWRSQNCRPSRNMQHHKQSTARRHRKKTIEELDYISSDKDML